MLLWLSMEIAGIEELMGYIDLRQRQLYWHWSECLIWISFTVSKSEIKYMIEKLSFLNVT